MLKQELSDHVVEGLQERYQFTWPDKKKAMLAANAPINKTLRPCREESVDFDNTENLYIEGDNLEVLKLLQETYLGKVKMIYIDPPYNTGKDFVYRDKFFMNAQKFMRISGQIDEDGNRLEQNLESSGHYHTKWLNMMYSRLKLAKDLLSDEGTVFISIDDHELENLKKIGNEIFGESNFIAQLNWKGRGGKQDSKYYAIIHEYILCWAKSVNLFVAGEEVKSGDVYPKYDEKRNCYYKTQLLRKWGDAARREDRPNMYYPIFWDGKKLSLDEKELKNSTKIYPKLTREIDGRWRWGYETMKTAIANDLIEIKCDNGRYEAYEKIYAPLEGEEKTKKYISWIDDVSNGTPVIKTLFKEAIFDYTKPPVLILLFLKMAKVESGDLILDFFSGSATTAHAVMQLNAEDGGHRKFIMVQLPEACDEKSEAFKAGYKNICEIGKERIRRAGQKIKDDNPLTTQDLDIGFRVLKLDSSNMEDVYYTPKDYMSKEISLFVDNVKSDRSSEDLLFQVMLDLGTSLSSKIVKKEIAGKEVFDVANGHIMACFDKDVNDDVITAIAKEKPSYFVMRDNSLADDSVAINFEQIFNTYSPNTERRVL